MIYANHNFYTNEYKGTQIVDNASFIKYAVKSTQYIKKYTLGNINEDEEIPLCVKMCCCDVAELLYKAENNDHSGVTSEKVGDLSVSYESADSQGQTLSKNIRSAIYLWLSGTDFLYRGV